MSAPLPITVCTLCLNEAQRLPRCLAQRPAFAEWLVLDTGSTDNSVEIATAHGATVTQARWQGFAATRREHFKLATQPWLLWIDADEVVTEALVAELRNLFATGPGPHAAWRANRLMHFDGRFIRHGDWYPDRVTRLFRSDAWQMRERAVHESVRIDGSVGDLQTELPHYSSASRADRTARAGRYAALWAEQAHAEGRTASAWKPALAAGWRFVRGYLLRAGFLEGRTGAWIAASNSAEVYTKYQALRALNAGDDPR